MYKEFNQHSNGSGQDSEHMNLFFEYTKNE